MNCPTCNKPGYPGECPPEPPVGTTVRDRFGGTATHQVPGGWAPYGCVPLAKWTAMWAARGPLEVV